MPAFFLLQLYAKERAPRFSDPRGSPWAGCSAELRGSGLPRQRRGRRVPPQSPAPNAPGRARAHGEVPCCTFWGGDSLVHPSNGFTGLSAAQPANQGQEEASKEPPLAPASTCTSEHEEAGGQPEPSQRLEQLKYQRVGLRPTPRQNFPCAFPGARTVSATGTSGKKDTSERSRVICGGSDVPHSHTSSCWPSGL